MVGEDSVQCPLREPTRADYYYGPSHYLERPTFEEPAPKHQRLSYSPVQATEQIFPIITSPKVPLPPKTQQPIIPTHVNVITPPIQQQHQPIQAIQSPIKPIESPTKQPQPQVHLPSSSSFLSSFSSSAFSSFSSSTFSSFSSASMSSSPSTSVSSSSPSSNSRALPLSPVESPVQLPIPSSSLPPPAHFSSPYSASFVLPSIPASHSSHSHSSFPSFSTSSSFSSSSFSSSLPARAESRRKSEQESLEGLVGLAGLAGLADIASQDSVQLKIERDEEETERGMHAAKEELNQLMERVCEQTGQSTSIIQDIKATALLNGMAVQEEWENTKIEQVIVKANRCIDNALDRARRRESELQNLFSTIQKATKAPPPPPPPVTTRQTRRSRKIK